MIEGALLMMLAFGAAPELPKEAPELAILARCMVCHGMEHVVQQRLTAQQWEKTLAKMQKWGMQLTPEETKALVAFLSARFTPDAPDYPGKPVPTPQAALPRK